VAVSQGKAPAADAATTVRHSSFLTAASYIPTHRLSVQLVSVKLLQTRELRRRSLEPAAVYVSVKSHFIQIYCPDTQIQTPDRADQ